MNDVDKVIASAIAMTHLSFSLGTFQIRLQVTQIYYKGFYDWQGQQTTPSLGVSTIKHFKVVIVALLL